MHGKWPLSSKLMRICFCGVSKTCTVDIIHGWNMHALWEQRCGTRKHLYKMHFNLILVFRKCCCIYVQEVQRLGLRTCMKRMKPQKAVFPFAKINLKLISSSLCKLFTCCWLISLRSPVGTSKMFSRVSFGEKNK